MSDCYKEFPTLIQPDNNPNKPSSETIAKSDVDGKRNGLISPFNAIAALSIDIANETAVKKSTSSGQSGLSAK